MVDFESWPQEDWFAASTSRDHLFLSFFFGYAEVSFNFGIISLLKSEKLAFLFFYFLGWKVSSRYGIAKIP